MLHPNLIAPSGLNALGLLDRLRSIFRHVADHGFGTPITSLTDKPTGGPEACLREILLSLATIAEAGTVPVGTILAYGGVTAPSGFALAYGQAVSRSAYPALWAAFGTTYGAGDASTTFNLPDLRGRVIAGQDDMGGTSANRLTEAVTGGINGDGLGFVGGTEINELEEQADSGAGVYASLVGSINNVQPTIILNYIVRLT